MLGEDGQTGEGLIDFLGRSSWNSGFLNSAFIVYGWSIFHVHFIYHVLNILPCSKTSSSEKAMVIGLGGLNLFGVVILGTMLQ